MVKTRPQDCWEHCFSMVGAWGYTRPEHCAPTSRLLAHLALVRTWGGNVLANFGPRPDGEMPDGYYRCMAEMAAWMKQCRPALVNVEPGPYPEKCNVPVTIHGTTWYALLIPKNSGEPASGGTIILDASVKPTRAVLLATGQTLPLRADGNKITITVPDAQRTALVDVVAIETP